MSNGVAIIERNESGNIVATYGQSTAAAAAIRKDPGTVLQQLISVFLPAGFPASVTEDYVGYQIYDSLQAFSSSIAGLLTSRAVLQGFGVGDANASATSALLLTILQDSVGRVATILFAYRFGPALEAECKMYRFLADIFNDSAMLLDGLSPVFRLSHAARIGLLCLSGSLKALCGVAGGASKASLSVHFAKTGNVGELNAKDSSQETVISLLGMLAGSFVVSRITSPVATWITLVSLLGIHLATNYKAVRCVAMRTLNRQRASIVYSWFWESGMVLTPNETARREAVLERSGVLRWADLSVMGFAEVGVQFATVLTSLAPGWAGSFDQRRRIQQLASIFHMQQYMLWPTRKHGHPKVYICLKTGATANDQVKAWCHALSVAKELRDEKGDDDEKRYERKIGILRATMDEMNRSFPGFASKLATKGWDLKTACIETCSGYRITVMLGEGHPGTIIIGERDGASEKRDRASEKLPGKIPGADRFGGNGDMAEIVGPGDAAKKGRDLDSSDISQKGYLEGKKVV